MIRLLVLSLLTSPICSRPGYRSSVMYGEKPILRLGPDESVNSGGPKQDLKEPGWVTNLRTNIQNQIDEVGFENAKPDIKDLIDRASPINSESDENGPEVQVQKKWPLRSGIQSRNAEWENDLKDYIKELVGTYESKQIEDFVKPVINSIEKTQHVIIKDIDGEVSVNYIRSGRGSNSNFPDPSFFKRRGPELEPGYTIAPE